MTRIYELIQELMDEGGPVVSVRDIIGWVDFREHMIVTYAELADALHKLHAAGRVARVLGGYIDAERDEMTEPFSVPTREEYDHALALYQKRAADEPSA